MRAALTAGVPTGPSSSGAAGLADFTLLPTPAACCIYGRCPCNSSQARVFGGAAAATHATTRTKRAATIAAKSAAAASGKKPRS